MNNENTKITLRKRLAGSMLIIALAALVATGCTNATTTQTQKPAATAQVVQGEAAGEAHGAEGGNESGGSESGSESGGESGIENPEGGIHNEEGSGSGSALALNQTFDTTRNGARLILNYDSGNNTFVGTVENTTTATLTRARIEVHLSNGVELGPTTPTDLAPGQILDISLPATAQTFDSWTPHAEVGSAEAGGGESGNEGGTEGTGGEGHGAGGEGGSEGAAEAGLEALMSSPITPISQSWSGNLGGIDVTGSYDANTGDFTSVATNSLPDTLCYVLTEPHLKMGSQTVAEMGPGRMGDINPGETSTLVLNIADDPGLAGVQFDGFAMHMEVYDCAGPGPDGGAPTINPLTGLPSGGEGGSEGSNEGSGGEGHGAGGEGGSESGGESDVENPEGGVHNEEGSGSGTALALDQTFDMTRNGARLIIRYDGANNAFIGTVENTTSATLTRARIEIHLSNGIELGPTTPTDLAPGQVIDIVLPATTQPFDSWTPHSEVGAGDSGGAQSGGEAGGEAHGAEGGNEGSEGGEGSSNKGGSESGGEGNEGGGEGHGNESGGG